MRTAAICPTCATYTNSICVIYNGVYLPDINASPLDTLDVILDNIDIAVSAINSNITNINNDINNINNNITTINNTISGLYPLFGTNDPSLDSSYIGQTYINISTGQLFYSVSSGTGTIWNAICNCTPVGSRIFDNTFDLSFN